MKNILIAIALLGMLSACSIGPKCTYTQEGTKITSWVWFYKDKPADLDKENCNCHCSTQEHSDLYGVCPCTNCDCAEECEVCQ